MIQERICPKSQTGVSCSTAGQLGAGKGPPGAGKGPPGAGMGQVPPRAGFDHPRNGMSFPGLGWILQELRLQGCVMFKAFSMHLKEK